MCNAKDPAAVKAAVHVASARCIYEIEESDASLVPVSYYQQMRGSADEAQGGAPGRAGVAQMKG